MATSGPYVFGHSDQELARLERQALFFADQTEDVLRRAGLRPGMRVLDIGCGVGDVSLIAGSLVGPTGAVVGIDRSPEALDVAKRRVEAAGFHWARFEQTDIDAVDGLGRFDALIGRFILVHLREPSAVLSRLTKVLSPGAVVAFLEMDISSATITPAMPLFDQCIGWIMDLYRRGGGDPDMGSRLYGVFRAAGLAPSMSGTCRVEGGPNATGYDYLADTIRNLIPSMEALGVVTGQEIGIEDLTDRLRNEAVAGNHCVVFPRLIGAWARVGEA
jgi:ubiquinone/menaquinone biosynthesis C-methylase UbiE